MLTSHRRARVRFLQVVDAGLFGAALLAAYALRAQNALWSRPALQPFSTYLVLGAVVMLLGPGLLAAQHLYALPRPARRLALVGAVVRGCVFAVVATILVLFLLRLQYARSVVLLTGAFAAVLVYARAEFTRWLDEGKRVREQLFGRTVWGGAPEETARLRARLPSDEREFLETVAEFDPRTETPAALAARLHEHSVNVVVVSLASLPLGAAHAVLAVCEREGVETFVDAGIFHTAVFRPELDHFAGEPVLCYRPLAAPAWQLLLKRGVDYAGALLLLVLLLPVYALVALAIRLDSPGPALFRQRRCGLNGRAFDMLKFRSMVSDAEQRKSALEPRNEMTGPVFKIADDPRVTRVGRFLRRHSLDELPQLCNELRGEMSLVGPRPLPVEEVHRFQDDAHRRRLSVLPGLTCLWQVRGRNDIDDFDDWVRLDLEYIDSWSLGLDFRILLATLPVVLFGTGGR